MKKVDHAPSKRYQEAKSKVDLTRSYPLREAIDLIKETATVKFDSGVDVHLRLNINPKKGDQQVRSTVSLPHGTGKVTRVAVITGNGDQQKAATAAGADLVGEQDLINQIKDGKIDFDVLVATPESMRLLAPIAKVLGPKGMMPNPKDGTVAANVGDAVKNLKKGKVSFKNDDSGNLHVLIGRASFTTDALAENFQSLIDSVQKAKPATVKGSYIKNVTIASSMGPGIVISLT
jgi:large subunit ribosomal protein L1